MTEPVDAGYRIGRLVDSELFGQLTTAPAIRL
jgi:hypothetical protein